MSAGKPARPRVFTLPASTPFLPALAEALLDGKLVPGFAPRGDALRLASATVYLPTRRATRAFAEALLVVLGTRATLLPRIVPLGDADEDALAFAETDRLPERPAPVAPAERRLVLARLVLTFAQATGENGQPLVSAAPAAAIPLADEVARLFDDMTIAGVDFSALDDNGFVPEEHDKHWQRSIEFLKIARKAWEDHLTERGIVDPTAWRDRLLAREAERIAADGSGPVIAAGSTGTIPAVARLIAAIARHPQGAVVLPGLDRHLDDASFAAIEQPDGGETSPGHPQFGLKRLLARMEVAREDVEELAAPRLPARERLLSEAFRPAATTDLWRARGAKLAADATDALDGFTLIEAADPREEALAIAVALREVLNDGDRHAALVTPDRTLARRVAAELRRWSIEVDDSAGVALGDTEAGRLARLTVTAAAEELAPVPLIALLRHPWLHAAMPADAVDALELAVLRGPRPAAGIEGLARALADKRQATGSGSLHRSDPRMRLSPADWDSAAKLVENLSRALAPLLSLAGGRAHAFTKLVAAHRAALTALGLDLTSTDARDGRALAQAFDQLAAAATNAAELTLPDYAESFALLLASEPPVRPPFDRHERLRIFGPLEARLIDSDRVILGGLNEGTWPPETRADAWLSRPMRRKLGLDLPERRIGLTAHDFAQALGAREVFISRARKQNGVEAVASRFLQRLAAISPDDVWKQARARGDRYRALARALEALPREKPAERPAPKPPLARRPARLSVTEIETLIRDPYSIYARHVLRLAPLDELDGDPGAGERGTILHEAFAAFTKAFPGTLPANALDELIRLGEQAFEPVKDFPNLHAIWWPRFQRAAEWFIGEERGRRAALKGQLAELSGRIVFDAGGREFMLTARADRIDLRKDGTVVIADYKTGVPPSLSQVLSGLAPQLALEAAIVREGGVRDVPAGVSIAEIAVIRVSGGHPAGTWVTLDPAKATGKPGERAKRDGIDTPDRLADVSRERVETLIREFAKDSAPYLSIPRPQWRGRFGEYDHLARIKEWSANEEGSA